MWPQNHRSLNFGNPATLGISRQNAIWMWASWRGQRVYYKGEGGGFPQVWVVVSLVSSSLSVACCNTKNAPTMH
jgi:hypothetical protein